MATRPVTDEPLTTTIKTVDVVHLSPDGVLGAACDFSELRAQVFPAVSLTHMTVHSTGLTSANVTEGTRVGPFVVWERCLYDWSQPGVVTATVSDSNIYAWPGSWWSITATPTEGGSRVEMVWERRFLRTARGRVMGFLYRRTGQRSFPKYAHDIARNLESVYGNAS